MDNSKETKLFDNLIDLGDEFIHENLYKGHNKLNERTVEIDASMKNLKIALKNDDKKKILYYLSDLATIVSENSPYFLECKKFEKFMDLLSEIVYDKFNCSLDQVPDNL